MRIVDKIKNKYKWRILLGINVACIVKILMLKVTYAHTSEEYMIIRDYITQPLWRVMYTAILDYTTSISPELVNEWYKVGIYTTTSLLLLLGFGMFVLGILVVKSYQEFKR